MKATLAALALVVALPVAVSAQTQQVQRDEQRAAIIGAAALFVPTYCPGWATDQNRMRMVISLGAGVAYEELSRSPMSEKVAAALELFQSMEDTRWMCSQIIAKLGPTGFRIYSPR